MRKCTVFCVMQCISPYSIYLFFLFGAHHFASAHISKFSQLSHLYTCFINSLRRHVTSIQISVSAILYVHMHPYIFIKVPPFSSTILS